jgi:hypothetical protein
MFFSRRHFIWSYYLFASFDQPVASFRQASILRLWSASFLLRPSGFHEADFFVLPLAGGYRPSSIC